MKQPGAPLYSPQDVPGFKEAEMSALQVGDKYRSPATRRLHIHWMRVENPLEFYETIALYKCGWDGKNSNLVIAESAGQIIGPDNPTCQLLPKDNERKVKVQEWT